MPSKNYLSTFTKFTASAVLLAPLTLHANHVDFIADGPFTFSVDEGMTGNATQTGNPGNILGTEREVSFVADVGNWNVTLAAPAMTPVGQNTAVVLAVTPDSSLAGAIGSLSLTYDGVGNAGLGNSDFDTTWNFIAVNIPTLSGALDLRLTVGDSDGDSATAALGDLNSPGQYFFAFDDAAFTNSGVDFDSVENVVFDFETINPDTVFAISEITREVVPEPSTSLLSVLASLGLLARRRRK